MTVPPAYTHTASRLLLLLLSCFSLVSTLSSVNIVTLLLTPRFHPVTSSQASSHTPTCTLFLTHTHTLSHTHCDRKAALSRSSLTRALFLILADLFLPIHQNPKLCRFLTRCRDLECERIGRFLTNRNSQKCSHAGRKGLSSNL